METTTTEFRDAKLTSEAFQRLLAVVSETLPISVPDDLLIESLRPWMGRLLSDAERRLLCWRIAGNLPRLRAFRPIPHWQGQSHREWVPAQIRVVESSRKRTGIVHWIKFTIQAGISCGLEIVAGWSPKQCSFYAQFRTEDNHGFMFSRPRYSADAGEMRFGLHTYRDARQFTQLRCLLLTIPCEADRASPRWERLDFTASQAAWNLNLQRHRSRLSKNCVCPWGFGPEHPCFRCGIGQDRCRWAVHAVTYEPRPCPRCGQEQAPFDPSSRREHCVNCDAAIALSQEKR